MVYARRLLDAEPDSEAARDRLHRLFGLLGDREGQIGLLELTYAAKVLNNKGISAVLCFGSILVLYFVLCFSLNRFAARLEVRLATSRHR